MEHNKSYEPQNLGYYINNLQNALQYSLTALFTVFSPKCFGRYCSHFLDDITKNTKVHTWLVVSSSQLTTFVPLYSCNVTLMMAAIAAETFW
jgi:hypothetical protein